ncbi:MAG TPA: IS1634 family transposase [Chloroflexi bacterium]|nr:IS1634 family transposase [Chloroflexota bacterium]
MQLTEQRVNDEKVTADKMPLGVKTDGFELDSKVIGALPIINHVLDRMRVATLLSQFVRGRGNLKIDHHDTLMIFLRSLMIQREPVYEIAEWSVRYEPRLLGLGDVDPKALGDDRFGRALDVLHQADRASMLTRLVMGVIKEFEIDTGQLHNDSTSVTVTGQYNVLHSHKGKPTVKLKHGHNKDHRPDLKQLVFTLTVSRDGAVPVHFKTYDGNVTDDKTHIETWDSLCSIVGNNRFTYVADCKLCTKEQMAHIHHPGGRFITVMPRTRKEDKEFRKHLRAGSRIEWQELLKKPKPDAAGQEHIYYGFESPTPSAEGYRVIWILSTQKQEFDANTRQRKVNDTITELAALKDGIGKRNLRTKEQIEAAVTKVFTENGTAQWFDWQLVPTEVEDYKQIGKGRPGKDTKYERKLNVQWSFTALPAASRINDDAFDDGIFPLITNHKIEELTARDVLEKYKYQPFLEKRHEQLKSVLEIAPVFFKLPHRIEALMFLEFIALMASALIERKIRMQMQKTRIPSLRLYPEARPCKNPTADRIFTAFGALQRHRLILDDMEVKIFRDRLSPLQLQILELLGVSNAPYIA